MPITVGCDSCGKKYRVADHLAGKRMRCKACQAVMEVPADGAGLEEEGELNLAEPSSAKPQFSLNQAIANAHRQAAGGGRPTPPRPQTRGDDRDSSHMGDSSIFEGADGGGGDDDVGVMMGSSSVANPPFRFAGSRELDNALPYVLTVAGLGWLVVDAIRSGDAHGHGWVPVVRCLVYLLLFFAIVYPLALKGTDVASKKLRFGKPGMSGLKVLAAFAFPYALGMILAIHGGNLISFAMGAAVGLIVGLAAFFFFFRLRSTQAPTALMTTGGFFLAGSAVALGLMVGLNAILLTMFNGYKTAHQYSESPVGPFLSWNAEKPPVEKPKKPDGEGVELATTPTAPATTQTVATTEPAAATTQLASVTPGTGESTTPVPAATANGEAPVTPATPANGDGAAATPAPGTPGAKTMVATAAPTDGGTPAPQPEQPATPAPAQPDATPQTPKLPPGLIDSAPAALAGAPTDFPAGDLDTLTFPPPTVGAGGVTALIVKSRETFVDNLEVWNLNGTPEKKAAIGPQHSADAVATYVAEAKGLYVAWLGEFPTKHVELRSTANEKFAKQIALDIEHLGEPMVLGFAMNQQIVVFWNRGGEAGVQAFNYINGQVTHRVNVPHFFKGNGGVSLALSPDGRYVAAVVDQGEMPGIQIVELFGSRSEPRVIPLPDLQKKQPNLSGMAFNADGTKLAVMYEEGNNTMLLGMNVQGGRIFARPVYLAPIFSEHPQIGEYAGPAIDWLRNDTQWLLYGRAVVDVERAAVLGKLGVDGVRSHQVVDRDTVALQVPGSVAGKWKLVMAKLQGGNAASKPAAK